MSEDDLKQEAEIEAAPIIKNPELPKPYYQDDYVTLYHADCREVLPLLEPVDLVLTDPPYGIGEAAVANKSRSKLAVAKDYGVFNWDNKPIEQNLINQLITQPAIIFGGNYYAMPPSACWLVWDKRNGGNDFADAELAWTNLPGAVRRIDYLWHGMIKQRPEQRWHPTQKPLDVMKWCITQADTKLKNKVATILDPFTGSGTTLRAAKDMSRKAIGIEREEQYCEVAANRLRQEVLGL
jgi:DNA modification methylase